MKKGILVLIIVLTVIQTEAQPWTTVDLVDFNNQTYETDVNTNGTVYWNNATSPTAGPRNGLINGSWEVTNTALGSTQFPLNTAGGRFLMYWSDDTYNTPANEAPGNVWSKTYTGLIVGQQYRYSFLSGYLLCNSCVAPTTPTLPSLSFSLDGTSVQSLPTMITSWRNASFIFTATATSHTLAIYNSNGNPIGNDFGVDDVKLETFITFSGTVFNDVNGLTDNVINGTGTGTAGGTQLYANLLDATGTTVIATITVNSNGTYKLPVSPNTNYQVQISTVQGIVNSAKPATLLPNGWINTGDVIPGGTATNATQGITAAIAVGAASVTGADFGIEELPESAVNLRPAIINPGGTNFITIPSSSFVTSNVNSNPNSQDYSGGSIVAIKLTSFPSNTTAIKISSVSYTSLIAIDIDYPNGINTDAAGNPIVSIEVDPADGLGSVVINFASIDNAGKQDITSGSVTQPFNGALAIKFIDFTGTLLNGTCLLNWVTSNELNMDKYEIEFSKNGNTFIKAGETIAANSSSINYYHFTYSAATAGKNYFRIKSLELNGKFEYSNILTIKNNANSTYSIYPNPVTTGNIVITGLQGGEFIKVIDNMGRAVLSSKLTGNSIDLSKMQKGLYHLQIIDKKQTTTVFKVMLQ